MNSFAEALRRACRLVVFAAQGCNRRLGSCLISALASTVQDWTPGVMATSTPGKGERNS